MRAVAAALAGVISLLLGPALLAPAAAVEPSPPDDGLPPAGRLSLASQTAWVAPGGSFSLRVDVDDVRRPNAVELALTVHEAVTSRSQFRRTLDGQLLGDVVWRRRAEPLAGIELDAGGAIPVTVDLRDPGDAFDPARPDLGSAGVHPVRVELRETGTGTTVDAFTTHLVRTREDDAPALAVAWVQPFGAPPALRPDGTVVLDTDTTDDLARTVAALGANPAPLTLVPTPETLDALAATSPPLLEQLRDAIGGRQAVAGPYVPIDSVALARAGLAEEIAAQYQRGDQVVASLLQAGPARQTLVADGDDLGPEALAGVDRLVAPEEALAPLDRPLTLANPFLVPTDEGRLVEAAAVDPGLTADFTSADDPQLAAHHLLADLAVIAYDSPGLVRGVVVRPPLESSLSTELLATALGALGTGSIVRPVTLEQLFDEVPPASAGGTRLVRSLLPPEAPGADLPAAEVRRTRGELASLAAMAEADAAVAALERLVLVAGAEELTGEQRRAYLEGARQGIDHHLAGVDILSSGSFRLTSREASIPLTVVNDLDTAMRVDLVLESDKLDFVADERAGAGVAAIPLVLQPGNTPVAVPVEARTSGDFPLLITLRSPDGNLDVAQARLTVRSTFLSGVGIALSAGAGLFLCVWWAGHWRTTRRDRRLVAPPG